MNERIARLKENLNAKKDFTGWFALERLKMESYLETGGRPAVLRRACMLAKLLEEMPIVIEPGDLLAGRIDDVFATSYNLFKSGLEDFDGYCGYPDLYDELEGRIPREEWEPVKDFWIGEQYESRLAGMFGAKEKAMMGEGVFFVEPVTGHVIFDAPTVLSQGFTGILERIGEKRAACGDRDTLLLYEAMEICLGAACAFARRFARLAAEMAGEEKDGRNRAALERMARACARVPEHPAESFFEAVQSFWLTYVIMHIEQTPNPYAFSVGRLDQFLYPYYQASRRAGGLSEEDALETLEALWLKFNVGNKVWAVSQNIAIGGVGRDGSDATNELTHLALRATEDLAVPLPTVTVKLHGATPRELLDEAAALSAKGRGNPTLINDEVVVRSKTATGVSLEDARDSAIAGCQEFLVQGAENARTTACWFSLPKCLELALNNGRSMLSGEMLGPPTGDPSSLTSLEEVERAFWIQVEHFLPIATRAANQCDSTLAALRPVPFISCIMKDCVDKGEDFRSEGARYNFSGFLCHGVANIADAFAALDEVVFKGGRYTLARVVGALAGDWEGEEAMRQTLINGAPKYGNDRDEVDDLAVGIAERITDLVPAYHNHFGGAFRPGFSTPSTHVLYGRLCGATPDGRHAREKLAYGIGPADGRAQLGPTAVLRSATKFPHWKAYHGLALNLSLPPSSVSGESGRVLLESLIEAYMDMGGRYLQFNIQDARVLREAQKHPGQWKDIIVRVHGMSAYFVNLDPMIQEDIIERVEAGL